MIADLFSSCCIKDSLYCSNRNVMYVKLPAGSGSIFFCSHQLMLNTVCIFELYRFLQSNPKKCNRGSHSSQMLFVCTALMNVVLPLWFFFPPSSKYPSIHAEFKCTQHFLYVFFSSQSCYLIWLLAPNVEVETLL